MASIPPGGIPPGLSGVLNEGAPARPRPAASVLLVRPATVRSGGWEVLMMRRPGGAEFAPGAHVFPGGSVHPEDRLLGDPIRGAAIRETHEEVGILLARDRNGAIASQAEADRVRLRVAHGVQFPIALRETHLEPAGDELIYFNRWVTPEQLRRRFDTRFYLARVPAGRQIHPAPGEVDHWLWISPQRALATPRFNMVFVTRLILESLAVDSDIESLWERHAGRRRVPIVRPSVRLENGTFQVVVDSLPAIPRARRRP